MNKKQQRKKPHTGHVGIVALCVAAGALSPALTVILLAAFAAYLVHNR